MPRIRFRVVFILLVLLLLIASAIFGLLTYWLDGKPPPAYGFRWESQIRLYQAPKLELEGESQANSYSGNLLGRG